MTEKPTIYPSLRYHDGKAAIDFLTRAFGLTASSVNEDADGRVTHAELRWGSSVVMLGSRGAGMELFDTGRCVLYLVVDDPDGHHDRAVAAGAEVVMALTDQPYGSRDYAALDPEGNVWSFGTYQPADS